MVGKVLWSPEKISCPQRLKIFMRNDSSDCVFTLYRSFVPSPLGEKALYICSDEPRSEKVIGSAAPSPSIPVSRCL